MARKRRVKWEPAALMVLVLGLGLWIAFGPASTKKFPVAPGAVTTTVLIGDTRGVLEAFHPAEAPAGEYAFRLWLNDAQDAPRVLTRAEAESFLGPSTVERCLAGRNQVFRLLNITMWSSLVWIAIGFLGQFLFSGRMFLQWIISEKRQRSVVTESFWWFSLIGGLSLFSYFVWRKDPVPMLGQACGVVIYARNIRLLRKAAKRAARYERLQRDPAPLEAAAASAG